MTVDEIHKITQSKELETVFRECKSFRLFGNKDASRDIACSILAFANRHGGKIIFGINNDGSFDEKLARDLDGLKGKIQNICYTNISPRIEVEVQLIEGDIDFLIVEVPRRKGIPHSYIKENSGHILERTYYIRTMHGKRPVNDAQLEWMFKDVNDPGISIDIVSGFEVQKQNLGVVGRPFPHSSYEIGWFFQGLDPEDIDENLRLNDKTQPFMLQTTIWALLKTFWRYFPNSWHIGISKSYNRMASGSLVTEKPVPMCKLGFSDLKIIGDDLFPKLNWVHGFKEYMNMTYKGPICLPPDSTIEIHFEELQHPYIKIVGSKYSLKIQLSPSSLGSGTHSMNAFRSAWFDLNPLRADQESRANFYYLECLIHYDAELDYLDLETEEFNMLQKFISNLKEIIDDNWNLEKSIKNYPSKEFYMTNIKLDKLLELAQKKGK
ncbi:MAG TPA: ATP-binding protein [Flavobacteriales bacterium]|nr:ATP-binding protein [Flavobacteriales bacterium]